MGILTGTSCGCDNRNGGLNGISPIFLILILCCCQNGDNNGFLGGLFGNNNGCGNNGGLDGILPILLILCLCGGSF